MNCSTCHTSPVIYHPSNFLLAIVIGTLGTLGIPGNAFLAWLISSEHQIRKPHDWLLFLLAVNDFLLCLSFPVMGAPFVMLPESVGCKIVGAMGYFLATAPVVFTPFLVSYNRYLALYDNQKYCRLFRNRNVILAWSFIMILSLVHILPSMVTGSLGQDELGICGPQHSKNLLVKIFGMCTTFIFYTTYTLSVYFSYKVIQKIRNHKKETKKTSGLESRLIRESNEIITVTLIISSLPLMVHIPPSILKTVQSWGYPVNPWISRISVGLFPITSTLNGYLTIFLIKMYRYKAMRLFNMEYCTEESTVAGSAEASGKCGHGSTGDGILKETSGNNSSMYGTLEKRDNTCHGLLQGDMV